MTKDGVDAKGTGFISKPILGNPDHHNWHLVLMDLWIQNWSASVAKIQATLETTVSSSTIGWPTKQRLLQIITKWHYSHFKEHLLPKIEASMGEKSDAHILFNLTVANDGQLPVKKYVEIDVIFWGWKCWK